MKTSINVGLMGLGTIGTGVMKILPDIKPLLYDKFGVKLEVKKILDREPDRPRSITIEKEKMTTDPSDILSDPDIDIVIELLGGEHPAREYILESLEKKKSVITANKDLIATCGREFFDKAYERGVDVFFEASVLGGIPVINTLKTSFTTGSISQLRGIVNGTTNYIITRMANDKMDFSEALKKAQELGIAESNPVKDIEAIDAAYKISILASIAFGVTIRPEQVFRKGIAELDYTDIVCARKLGYCIKLLASAKDIDNENIEVRVHPALIPLQSPLANVNDEFNAILLKGNYVGDMMFYGRGAGQLPTASAVIGDLIKAVQNIIYNTRGKFLCTCIYKKNVIPPEEIMSRFYVRLKVSDQIGSLGTLTTSFARAGVNISDISQKTRTEEEVELIILTHKVKYKNILDAVALARESGAVTKILNFISIEDEI